MESNRVLIWTKLQFFWTFSETRSSIKPEKNHIQNCTKESIKPENFKKPKKPGSKAPYKIKIRIIMVQPELVHTYFVQIVSFVVFEVCKASIASKLWNMSAITVLVLCVETSCFLSGMALQLKSLWSEYRPLENYPKEKTNTVVQGQLQHMSAE